MKNICIVGTGGFAREILFLIDELGLYENVKAFIEPDEIFEAKFKDAVIMGKKVLPFSDMKPSEDQVTIAIADPALRELTTTQLPQSTEYISLVHPTAQVSRWAEIGRGAIITAGCIVTTNITIGEHTHLNLLTTIGHDCEINDYFTTAPSTNISGNCNFGARVYFGTGAATRQGVKICNDVVIGMGSMVVKSINEPGTYIGIPAKKLNR